MKLIKAIAIGIVVAIGAALMVASVNAQSPAAAPTTNAPVGSIPEEPPQYWMAEGGTQGQWTAMREHCRAIFAERKRRGRMSGAQASILPPLSFSHEDVLQCVRLSASFAPHYGPPTSPAAAPGGASPPQARPSWRRWFLPMEAANFRRVPRLTKPSRRRPERQP